MGVINVRRCKKGGAKSAATEFEHFLFYSTFSKVYEPNRNICFAQLLLKVDRVIEIYFPEILHIFVLDDMCFQILLCQMVL